MCSIKEKLTEKCVQTFAALTTAGPFIIMYALTMNELTIISDYAFGIAAKIGLSTILASSIPATAGLAIAVITVVKPAFIFIKERPYEDVKSEYTNADI